MKQEMYKTNEQKEELIKNRFELFVAAIFWIGVIFVIYGNIIMPGLTAIFTLIVSIIAASVWTLLGYGYLEKYRKVKQDEVMGEE